MGYKTVSLIGVALGLWLNTGYAQECVPVAGHPDAGNMKGTVVSAVPAEVLVKSNGLIYHLDWKESQRDGIHSGDFVQVQYNGLLNCYRADTWVASVVSITKAGRSSTGAAIPSEAVTAQGRVVLKMPSGRFHLQTGPGNPLILDISKDNPSFMALKIGDRVRVTYVGAGCSGPMAEWCLGTALRIVKISPSPKKRP